MGEEWAGLHVKPARGFVFEYYGTFGMWGLARENELLRRAI